MFVKPAPGLRIPDPQRHDILPADGRDVPAADPYWQRALRDGDVVAAAEAALHPAQGT